MYRQGNRRFRPDRRTVLAGGAALATTALVAACGGEPAPMDDQGRVRLRFSTDDRARAEHGGFYQALASGLYERRGLNVQILQGGLGANVPQRLASGSVELGLADSSFTALDLAAEGAPVRAVAAFFQKDPQALIAHPDPELTEIAELADRLFQLTPQSVARLWPWLKARYGFRDDQLADRTDDLAPFLADDQAVRDGWLTTEPSAVAEAGDFQPRVLLPADEGYPAYGCLVLSPNGFARDNAEALRGFIAASAEGWRDYIRGDPARADALIRRDNPEMTQAELDQARQALIDNGVVDGGDAALYGLGAMTEARWSALFEIVAETGAYPGNLDWRDAFTAAYLPGRG